MAMIYTLVTSAKDWLSERFGQNDGLDNPGEEEAAKDDVCFLSLVFGCSSFSYACGFCF